MKNTVYQFNSDIAAFVSWTRLIFFFPIVEFLNFWIFWGGSRHGIIAAIIGGAISVRSVILFYWWYFRGRLKVDEGNGGNSCGDTGELAASTSSRCWILKSVLRLVLVVISLHQSSSRRALPLTSREECGERDGVRGHNVKKVKRWADKIRPLSLKSGIVLSPGSPVHSPIHQIFPTAFRRVQVCHVSIR